MKFSIVSATISVYLGSSIPFKDTSHCPFTVDKASVTYLNRVFIFTDRTFDLAIGPVTLQIVNTTGISSINDYKFLIGSTRFIVAVSKPTEAITDLSEPRGFFLPGNLFHILYCVKSEINTQGHLRYQSSLTFKIFS